MVSKAFIVLLHAVVLLFIVANILHIGIDIAFDLPAEFLAGIVLHRIQQISDAKGCQEFSVFHF